MYNALKHVVFKLARFILYISHTGAFCMKIAACCIFSLLVKFIKVFHKYYAMNAIKNTIKSTYI